MQNAVSYCIFRKKFLIVFPIHYRHFKKLMCEQGEGSTGKALTTQSWQPEFNCLNHEKCQIHWNVSANPDSKKGGRERKMPWRLEDQLPWYTQQKRNNRDPTSNKVEGKKWQSRLSSTWLLSHMSTFIQKFVHTGTYYTYKTIKISKKTTKLYSCSGKISQSQHALTFTIFITRQKTWREDAWTHQMYIW